MDQFDKAEERAEKDRQKRQRYQPLVDKPYGFDDIPTLAAGTLHLPKSAKSAEAVKTPAKRTNEIGITVYCDGAVFEFTARANLNDIIASQRNRAGFAEMLRAALAVKLGRVEIT